MHIDEERGGGLGVDMKNKEFRNFKYISKVCLTETILYKTIILEDLMGI